jgi:outer membrane lipoprotein-sorting protein
MAFGLLLVLSGASRAEEKNVRPIIEKAIQAAGGEKQLAKYQAMTFKEKGTYYGEGTPQPYTGKYAVQFPDQFRMEIVGVFTMVIDGNKGWMVMGGNTQEMNKEQLAEQKESQYTGWVTTLLPLQKDKTFQLSPLGESKVGDRTVVGIQVSHPGHPDVKLYFDKDSGLMAKCVYHVKSWMTGKEMEFVSTYERYKQFDDVKFPTKMEMKRDGKQYVEAEVEDVKPLEKPDASLFAKP